MLFEKGGKNNFNPNDFGIWNFNFVISRTQKYLIINFLVKKLYIFSN